MGRSLGHGDDLLLLSRSQHVHRSLRLQEDRSGRSLRRLPWTPEQLICHVRHRQHHHSFE